MVAGNILARDGAVLTADERAVRAEAQMRVETLAEPVVADPVHKRMALFRVMEAGWL